MKSFKYLLKPSFPISWIGGQKWPTVYRGQDWKSCTALNSPALLQRKQRKQGQGGKGEREWWSTKSLKILRELSVPSSPYIIGVWITVRKALSSDRLFFFDGGPSIMEYNANIATVVEILKSGGEKYDQPPLDKYSWPYLRNTVYVLFWSRSQIVRASKIWRGEVLGCKSIPATFPICPNWLWGVIHWTRTHTEETNKERQRNYEKF